MNEVKLLPRDFLKREAAPVGRIDRNAKLLILSSQSFDLRVELTRLFPNFFQLQNTAIRDQQQGQNECRRSKRHEKSDERQQNAGEQWRGIQLHLNSSAHVPYNVRRA